MGSMVSMVSIFRRALFGKAAFGLLVVGLLAVPLLASTQKKLSDTDVVERITPTQVKDILSQEGYTNVTIDEDDDLIFSIEGTKVLMLTSTNQNNLLIRAAWARTNATLERVNEWNRTVMYSRAFIDRDGDPVLELDIKLTGGVSVKRIKDFVKDAKISIAAFRLKVLM